MRTVTAFALAVVAGCTPPAPPPAPPPPPPPIDEATVKQAVTEVWNRLNAAQLGGSVDAFLAEFAGDATLDIQGTPPVAGRAALDSLIRPQYASGKVTAFKITPAKTTVVSNDLALQGGSYFETFVVKGKATTEYGRYATSVMRGRDGQWKIAYWMGIHDSIVAAR